jgi:hypothetical protein
MDPKYEGRHCVFMGIRVWDALADKFVPPEGSVSRACSACAEPTYVQASSIKVIESGVEHSIICYRCARKLPLGLIDPKDVEMVPEAIPELVQMLKTRRQ